MRLHAIASLFAGTMRALAISTGHISAFIWYRDSALKKLGFSQQAPAIAFRREVDTYA